MQTSSHQVEFGSGRGGVGGGDDEERKWRNREALRHIIGQWNGNRLDLFSLSEHNEVNNTTVKLAATHHCNYNSINVLIRYLQEAGHKVHPCEFEGIGAGRHRDADWKVPSRHEEATHNRLRPLRDPPQRR